jgi:hypothetical protein
MPDLSKKKLNTSLISGTAATISSFKEVEKELTRSIRLCSDLEWVSAKYITPYSVELKKKEEGARELDAQALIEKSIQEMKKDFTINKECFQVSITGHTLGFVKFSFWRFKVKDSKGELYEAFPLLKGVDNIPNYTVTQIGTIWNNSNFICTQKDIKNPEQGFELIPISQLTTEKCQGAQTTLSWEKP